MSKKSNKKVARLASLDHNYNPRVRWEAIDADYLKKLSPDELNWYAQFMDEYVGGSIEKDKRTGKPKKHHIHNTNELAKSCYDANNRRNNDLMSVAKATNRINSLEKITEDKSDRVGGSFGGVGVNNGDNTIEKTLVKNPQLQEDAIISQIDSGEQNEQLTFKEYIKVRKLMTAEAREKLDLTFVEEQPRAYMYYYIYDNTRITDGKLDKLLENPLLLEKFIEDFEFFKRKKNRTHRRKRVKNSSSY